MKEIILNFGKKRTELPALYKKKLCSECQLWLSSNQFEEDSTVCNDCKE